MDTEPKLRRHTSSEDMPEYDLHIQVLHVLVQLLVVLLHVDKTLQ